MAVCSSLSVLSVNSAPRISSEHSESSVKIYSLENAASVHVRLFGKSSCRSGLTTKLNAGGKLALYEPDLNEDPKDRWATNGVDPLRKLFSAEHYTALQCKYSAPKREITSMRGITLRSREEDFIYGEYDDHHTYFEGEAKKGTFWGAIADDIKAVEPPTGFQGFISWIFLPAVAAGMFFNVPGEYLFIGAAVFVTIFTIIELDKPDKPHNFEPEIYNMERGARDKLINDYNTMSIWEFNEKYGHLWDFTVDRDEITKR